MKYLYTICLLVFFGSTKVLAQESIACINNISVSLSAEGARLTPEMLTQGDISGMDLFITLSTAASGGTTLLGPDRRLNLTCEYLGKYSYKIEDANTGNSCWGEIMIEDKIRVCDFGGDVLIVEKGLCNGYNLLLNGSEILNSANQANNCVKELANVQAGTNTVELSAVNIEAFNGISTLDLVLMMKAILVDSIPFTPQEAVITDIDMDGTVSTIDLVNLRGLILGLLVSEEDFAMVRMFRSDHDFGDFNPYNFVNDYSSISFTEDELTGESRIYVEVLKVGDFNNNARFTEDKETEIRSNANLQFTDQYLSAGREYTINFTLDKTEQVTGLLASLKVEGAEITSLNSDYGSGTLMSNILRNQINLSLLSLEGVSELQFALSFKSENSGWLSEQISLVSELSNDIVDLNNQVSKLQLISEKPEITAETRIFPNPTSQTATLEFASDYAEAVKSIRIFDMNGAIRTAFSTNENIVSINQGLLLSSGVYIVEWTIDGQTNQEKFIVNK